MAVTQVRRVKISLSPLGRSVRLQNSIVMYVLPTGAFTAEAAQTWATNVGGILADIMPTPVTLMDATFTRMNDDNSAIRADTVSAPINQSGEHVIPGTSALGNEHDGLILEKAFAGPRPSKTFLRYALTTDEIATYQETGALPTRIADYGGEADGLGPAIREAAIAAGLPLVAWIKQGGIYVSKPVTGITVAGAGKNQPTRRRVKVETSIVRTAQRRINALWAAAKRLWRRFQGVGMTADITTTIVDLFNAARAILMALGVIERAKIAWPAWATLIGVVFPD